jgi:hypothetical protein
MTALRKIRPPIRSCRKKRFSSSRSVAKPFHLSLPKGPRKGIDEPPSYGA